VVTTPHGLRNLREAVRVRQEMRHLSLRHIQRMLLYKARWMRIRRALAPRTLVLYRSSRLQLQPERERLRLL
jgi:hypothetical protein